MFKKAFLLSALYFSFAVIFTACCNCPEVGNFKYDYTKLSLKNYAYKDTLGQIQTVRDSTTDYESRNFLLNLHFGYDLIAANYKANFFNTAYACKCVVGPVYTPVNYAVGIKVFTLNNYDSLHAANSDITSYFGSTYYDQTTKTQKVGILQPALLQNGFIQYDPLTDDFFYLLVRPTISGNQQFKVVIELNDGSSFQDTTSVLQF